MDRALLSAALFLSLAIAGCGSPESDDLPVDTSADPVRPPGPDDTGVAPGCDNGIQDTDETDVDCGGSCEPCGNELACAVNADCVSGRCDAGVCAACTDRDQCDEGLTCDLATGACTDPFALGDVCTDGADCLSGSCVDGVCCAEACEGACLACSIAEGGESDGVCTPAFVDRFEPGVCDDTAGACGDDVCACDDAGACVPNFIAKVDVGGVATCIRYADGTMKCWGGNIQGQLGVGDTDNRGDDPDELGASLPSVLLGTGRTARDIATGSRFSCAVLDDGSAKCWGTGGRGQLGQEDNGTLGRTTDTLGDALPPIDLGAGRTAVRIFAGHEHTCAILDDDRVKCWGENASGELALGDVENRGDDADEMGDALDAVDLGPGVTAVALALGDGHTCAILDDGRVKCWGQNDDGELGLEDADNRGDDPGDMSALDVVDLGTGRTATTIVAGGNFTCARLDNATVKCWGANGSGQLGQGDTDSRGDDPDEMGDDLPAVPLGAGRTARDLAASYSSACALLDDATVKCWGANSSGQLGQGDTDARGDDPDEMGDNLDAIALGGDVEAVSGQGSVFCAHLVDGRVKCWGANQVGQLGLGDRDRRGDNPDEMGDDLPPVPLD